MSPPRAIAACLVGGDGRLGRQVARLLAADPGWRHVSTLLRRPPGGEAVDAGAPRRTDAVASALVGAEVVIDTAAPPACRIVGPACAAARLPYLVASTALGAADQAALRAAAERAAVLHAPNLSRQAVVLGELVARAVAQLAPQAGDVAIEEIHHRHKRDAPSGTALVLAAAAGGAPVHSLRLGDGAGEHRVIIAAAGERLELSHRCASPEAYGRGALAAARWLVGRPAGLYGVADWLAEGATAAG